MRLPDYWIPKYRYQAEEFLVKRFPADKAKFAKMRTRQIFAIYHSVRKKENGE